MGPLLWSCILVIGAAAEHAKDAYAAFDQQAHPRGDEANRIYGTTLCSAVSLTVLGFSPAYVVGVLKRYGWYTDALSMQNPPDVVAAQQHWKTRWTVLVTWHATLALLWILLAAS
eukprot:TRINITY_DN51399_c0_g1_i1.p1 TRINITY_DN51399_c0_g1~~TRINITY_DN51399_c0_g1_i1.p1  ORF type:complete len:115 (-),score=25.31 TRINITY_DN51399_c0_g1_i1:285-629(-)